MRNNRFAAMQVWLSSPESRFNQRPRSRASEAPVQPGSSPVPDTLLHPDDFLIALLQYFFEESLQRSQLNDALGDVGAEALWRAAQGSTGREAMPRPPKGHAQRAWLAMPAVQQAYQQARQQGAYQGVRPLIRTALQEEYDLAKNAPEVRSPNEKVPYPLAQTTTLTVSDAGVALISSFESFRSQLYNDPVGHCTIGFGTLIHRGNCNGSESEEYRAGISRERATALMRQDLATIEAALNDPERGIQVTLNQAQFDALASWTYNVGVGAMRRSTLRRLLNGGDYDSVPTELDKWVKASGRTLRGLVRRRAAEGRLFRHGTYPTAQSLEALEEASKQPPVPRGIRNNNPGNIRISRNNDWEGRVPLAQNTDGAFEQFTSFAYGVRALIMLLRNYLRTGRNTARRIAGAYAPPSDGNHTAAYSRFLAERLHTGEQEELQLNRQTLQTLVQAIGRMENGQECVSEEQFQAGYALLPEAVRTSLGQSLMHVNGQGRLGSSLSASDHALVVPYGQRRRELKAGSARHTHGAFHARWFAASGIHHPAAGRPPERGH